MEKYREFPAEIKKTKQREEIFHILSQETKPVSAVDIYGRLVQTTGNTCYAISTIYRALTVFEKKGYVTKSTLMGEDMAYYEWNYGTHRHYAVCLKCHKLIPLKSCPFEGYLHDMHSDAAPFTGDGGIRISDGEILDGGCSLEEEVCDFTVTGHRLELYGYCRDCKPDLTKGGRHAVLI